MASPRVTKIRFHAVRTVLDQGLMRYFEKIIYDENFYTEKRLKKFH